MTAEIVRLFHQGGVPVMASITMVLLFVMVIIIERTYRYWFEYDLVNSDSFMSSMQMMVMQNSVEHAIRLCKKARPRLLPYVLLQGLKRANDTSEEIEYALERASLEAIPKIQKSIGLLGMSANVATLLGLLGTIFGLMKSFGGAAHATGAQKQTILAEGIAEALTATSYGLSTALICIAAHGILSSKQNSIVADINQNAARLMDLLYTRKMRMA